MNNIKDFNGDSNLRSLLDFWVNTGPMLAGVLVINLIVVAWEREPVVKLRVKFAESPLGTYIRKALKRNTPGENDPEKGASAGA